MRGFAHNGTPGGNFHNRQGFFYFFWTIFVNFDKIAANCAENAHIARRDAHRTEMFKKKRFFWTIFVHLGILCHVTEEHHLRRITPDAFDTACRISFKGSETPASHNGAASVQGH